MKRLNEQMAIRVSMVTVIWNILLSGFKLIAGVFGHSGAMISDAVHSISDVFSTFIVMIGVKLAGKKPDKEHPYGHERFECVAAIILAVMLFVTGASIGVSGTQKIFSGNAGELVIPTQLPLIAAILSIIIKEGMYWYTRFTAKKINSGALMADAWHHRSDALSSIGSFIGILGARLGFPILDPIASIVICVFILKVAVQIFMASVGKMTDKACDAKLEEEMKRAVLQIDGVLGIDQMRTRLFGDKVYVDIEILVVGSDSLEEAHSVAHKVHDLIEKNYPQVKHCMVHMNPFIEEVNSCNFSVEDKSTSQLGA